MDGSSTMSRKLDASDIIGVITLFSCLVAVAMVRPQQARDGQQENREANGAGKSLVAITVGVDVGVAVAFRDSDDLVRFSMVSF
jgi:hypothetical protein